MINKKHIEAAVLSQASYLDYDTIKKVFDKKFDNITFFSGKSTQAYLFSKGKIVFITFRGTEINVEDIKKDFDYKKEYMEHVGMVHAGFLNALKEVSEEILRTLQNHKGKKIYIAGHSLGGALALLFGLLLHTKNIPFSGIYTFGQPRVLSRTAAKYIENQIEKDKILRFINNKDIVARVPLHIQGFGHIGQVWFFDSKSKVHFSISIQYRVLIILQDLIVNNWFLLQFPWQIFTKITKEALENHKMDHYLRLTLQNFYTHNLSFLIPSS